jgi:simple sugar transport system permease protein
MAWHVLIRRHHRAIFAELGRLGVFSACTRVPSHPSSRRPSVPSDIVLVLEGLIVLFVAAPPLIRAIFRLRESADAGLGAAKGWNG